MQSARSDRCSPSGTSLRDLDVRVLAGEASLDVPVRWVHISELADPTPWLSGGELLLTTGMDLRPPRTSARTSSALADHGLAGLGLGVGFAHAARPRGAGDAAAERDFPLFEVPYDTPFIAVTEKAFTQLVNEQYAVLQRSIAAQERLQRIVLTERGLDGARRRARRAPSAARRWSSTGAASCRRAHFRRELDPATVESARRELRERARRGDARGFVPISPSWRRALALPVAAPDAPAGGGLPQAWLVAVKDAAALSEFDRLSCTRRSPSSRSSCCAAASPTTPSAGWPATCSTRSSPASWRAPSSRAASSRSGSAAASARSCSRPASAAARGAVEARARRRRCATRRSAGWSPAPARFVLRAAARLPATTSCSSSPSACAAGGGEAGAGPAAGRGPRRPRRRRCGATFHEARCALEARELRRAGGGNGAQRPRRRPARRRLATYRDLGSFQLLLSLQDDDALRLFCDSLLGADRGRRGPLRRRADALARGLHRVQRPVGGPARRLYCHRHTLRYRIRKIEELTGRDLGSARDRIEFWLALRGREIVPPSTRTDDRARSTP